MTKEMMKATANDVLTMNEEELNKFGVQVSMSSLDAKSKMYLYQFIEDRLLQLRTLRDSCGASVVVSEIREGEL